MKKISIYKFIAFVFVATLVTQLLFNSFTKFIAPEHSILDQYADSVDVMLYQNIPMQTLALEYNKTKQELFPFG